MEGAMYREGGDQSGFSYLPGKIPDNIPDNRAPEKPEKPTVGQTPGDATALGATPPMELRVALAPREFDPQHTLPASLDVTRGPHAGRKSPWRRFAPLLAGTAVLIAASSYGWHYWTTGRFEESTDDAYVEADATIIAPKVAGYLILAKCWSPTISR